MTQLPPLSIKNMIEYVLHDRDGNEILRVGMNETTLTEPDGTEVTRKISDYIETVDGLSWSGIMLTKNPPILLTVCATCRNPPRSLFKRQAPTHGLGTAFNTIYCVGCGDVVCPRHRCFCSDEQWRCPRCARRFRRRMFIRRIFFTPVEKD